jgi:hypothetical protein
MRTTLAVLALVAAVASAADAPPTTPKPKDGWTGDELASATDGCTEQLVQGTWDNTKRAQGVNPSKPLTPEIRAELAPQIEAMRKLCACAVREASKRYSKKEAEGSPKDLDRFVADVIARGVCKLERK